MKRGRISSATDSNSKRGKKETAKISSFSQYYRFQLIVKRGWILKGSRKRKRKGKVSHIIKTHEYSGPSFSDLPKDILLNILLRLPVKKILVSKYVCKTWYEQISDPEFAKLYYDQCEGYPLIQGSGSEMVYLMQPDKADFELKLGMSCDHCSFKPGCVCNVHVKLDTIFEILQRAKNNEKQEYSTVNSCNGLLCLFNTYGNKDHHHIVCNPITGEFIELPVPSAKRDKWFRYNFAFGFSPASNQYKVIRMYEPHFGVVTTMAELHIIGTKTWKQIGYCIKSMFECSFSIYLNGFVYWSSYGQPLSLISFDVANECFDIILGPAIDERCISKSNSVGVLGGELCISAVLKSHIIHVWIRKDNGTEREIWSKVFSFDLINSFQTRRNYGPFQPIKYLNDETLLMVYNTDSLVYLDPETNRMRYMKVRGSDTNSLIAHIPSFVSLKHTFSGQNVKVLNVKSRSCAELKVQEEAKDIFLVEDEFCLRDTYY